MSMNDLKSYTSAISVGRRSFQPLPNICVRLKPAELDKQKEWRIWLDIS